MKLIKKLLTVTLMLMICIGVFQAGNVTHADEQETQEVKVTVHWDDDENAKNYRPETFTVNLYTEKLTEAYAVYDSSDQSLVFFRDDIGKYQNNQTEGTKTYYSGFETVLYEHNAPAWTNNIITSTTFKDIIKPISTSRWFFANQSLDIDLTNLDTSDVVKMNMMFANSHVTSLDLSSFNTEKVTDMYNMFSSSKVTSIVFPQNFGSNATNMGYMFASSKIPSLDLSNFNTSNATRLQGMFYGLAADSIIFPQNFGSNATDMSFMFNNSKITSSMDLSRFNTSNVTEINGMFNKASIPTLDLSNFNIEKVTKAISMFEECQTNSITFPQNFGANISHMSFMFSTSKITSLDLSNFNTSNAIHMNNMFYNGKITSLNLSSFDTSKVENMTDMFKGSEVTSITLGENFNFKGKGTISSSKRAILPSSNNTVWNNGSLSKTSAELRDNYAANASSWSGTWTRASSTANWQNDVNKSLLANVNSVADSETANTNNNDNLGALKSIQKGLTDAKDWVLESISNISLKPAVVNAEGEDGKYSLTLPTADGDVDYIFHIPMNEEITRITAQEPNTHYEQDLNLDLSDMDNLRVNMHSTGPKVPGSTAKLKKYLVVKNDAEIPEAEFSFTVSAGTAIGAADNHATVYAGKDSDKVKVNGTAKTGKVTFTAGEETNAGPLTGVATADQKYVTKDIVLDFSQISFDEPGVYRYILTEQENTNSAINNDSEPVRVVDVHVMWNDDETELVVDGYVGYYGTVTEAPKLLPDFEYEYEDTNGDEVISNEEKAAQKEAYQEAYDVFISSIEDGSGKPAGSYVNAQEPIEVEAGEKSDKYVNDLDSANILLTKEVVGNQGSRDQYFEFTVAITNAGKNTVMTLDMSEAENGITHENEATSFSKVSMDEANTKDDDKTDILYTQADYDAYVTENDEEPEWAVDDIKIAAKTGQQIIADENGSVTFKLYLHHDQVAKLQGIPKDAQYTITETTAAGYKTTSENETGIIDTEDITVKFINERGGVVPTGILLQSAGAIIMVMLSIFGIALRFKKRLQEN